MAGDKNFDNSTIYRSNSLSITMFEDTLMYVSLLYCVLHVWTSFAIVLINDTFVLYNIVCLWSFWSKKCGSPLCSQPLKNIIIWLEMFSHTLKNHLHMKSFSLLILKSLCISSPTINYFGSAFIEYLLIFVEMYVWMVVVE